MFLCDDMIQMKGQFRNLFRDVTVFTPACGQRQYLPL